MTAMQSVDETQAPEAAALPRFDDGMVNLQVPPTYIHRLRQRTFTASGQLAPSFPSSSPRDTSFSL